MHAYMQNHCFSFYEERLQGVWKQVTIFIPPLLCVFQRFTNLFTIYNGEKPCFLLCVYSVATECERTERVKLYPFGYVSHCGERAETMAIFLTALN